MKNTHELSVLRLRKSLTNVIKTAVKIRGSKHGFHVTKTIALTTVFFTPNLDVKYVGDDKLYNVSGVGFDYETLTIDGLGILADIVTRIK